MIQLVKNLPANRRPVFDPWVGKILGERTSLPTPVFWPAAYSPWGHKELYTAEHLSLSFPKIVLC